jgi:hypothetical protein
MASTTNFNWSTPDDTALVKDGAAAIRTLGSSIDTSFVDLKGGTTGQVLAKASNTDLDFSFVTPATSPLTTKGDLFTFSTTAARLPVGTNGQVLTADSAEATGLKFATPAPAGGMTQLATGSLSGTTTTISSISGAYKNLVIRLDSPDVNNNTVVIIRFNTDSASNYRYVSIYSDQYNTVQNSGADSGIQLITTLAADGTNAGSTLTVFDYSATTQYKPIQYTSAYKFATSSVLRAEGGFGAYVSASAITSVSIIAGSTNTLTGTYYIYGVN